MNTESAYYDGIKTDTASVSSWPANFDAVKIGAGFDTSRYWRGQIDEVRISDSIRSADWIAAEYNNQNSPSTFYTLGPEN